MESNTTNDDLNLQVDSNRTKPKGNVPSSYTLEQYSDEKRLPLEFLVKTCKISTQPDWRGIPYLHIPYLGEDGKELTHRKRYGGKEFRWKKGTHARDQLYGLHLLPRIREVGCALLVEGESDAQTLWFLGFPALGVPGAALFSPAETAFLRGLTVFIHQEPDKGGETFVETVKDALLKGGFDGVLRLWRCCDIDGSKDPSALFYAHGAEEAKRLIEEALKNASTLSLEEEVKYIEDAPIQLVQPRGWHCTTKEGICTGEEEEAVSFCRTPVLLTKRLINGSVGTEKVEVSFHRDGRWRSVIVPRTTLFQRKTVTELANYGCTVTSENAKRVVQFLSALEAANAESIPKTELAGTYGWQKGHRFFPDAAGEILPDPDLIPREVSQAFSRRGSLEAWLDSMDPHRSRDTFRFLMAASFAAPLLRIVDHRNFVIYNWCDSRGGKTAAPKAAASVWGSPDGLLMNFNATSVGLERTATLFCDIPLIIDERQLSTDDQRSLDKAIYLIANGKGRTRGSRGGGLQSTGTWRTIALCNGEEPVVAEDSKTGVSTRALEVYGAPFDDETSASEMHQLTARHHGHAGLAFVARLRDLSEERIREAYEEMCDYLKGISDGSNLSHVSSVAVVALADAMADSWIFARTAEPQELPEAGDVLAALGIRVASWERAKKMAKRILRSQVQINASDVNENAVQYIVDWVLSNKSFFAAGNNGTWGTCYGLLSEDGSTAWIYPSCLDEALKRQNYNAKKTKQYMAEQGYITSSTEAATGKKRYTVVKQPGPSQKKYRMVEFRLDRCAAGIEESVAVAFANPESSPQPMSGTVVSMFPESGGGEQLPLPL